MAEAYRKYSTAKKHADGKPVVRVSDLYITGVDDIDEVSVIRTQPDGAITAHITLRHLDRLGNGNHAIAVQPMPVNAYDLPTTDVVGVAMRVPEAMALWTLLDAALAGQFGEVSDIEKLRWTRDRLARVMRARSTDFDAVPDSQLNAIAERMAIEPDVRSKKESV